jgi:tellurite resistance protein TehA-like permease
MSTELGASLLSLALAAVLWWTTDRLIDWLAPELTAGGERDGVITLTIGPFVLSFVAFILTLFVAIGFLAFDHVPSDQARPSYGTFFSTAALVLVGLLIAIAITVHDRGLRNTSSEARGDVVQGFVLIALGEILSLIALLPRLPDVLFGTALITVPASVIGATVVITLVGFVSPTPASGVDSRVNSERQADD